MSAVANMHSANLHPEVITGYLHREISLGRMLGPFPRTFAAPELQLNRFGVIPKGHNSGKWRLITDLSFPPGKSVNDGVDPALCSLTYTTVDQVAEIIANLGGAALMAKVDIESAYSLVPVHPHDRALQALQWQGQIYVDPMLPFGLRSAPKIFNAVADGFHWHLKQRGINRILDYLDDFIIVAPPVPQMSRGPHHAPTGCEHPWHPNRWPEDGRSSDIPRVPGDRGGCRGRGIAPPQRQTPATQGPTAPVGESKGVHPKGAGVTGRSAEPRVQGGPLRAFVSAPNDRPAACAVGRDPPWGPDPNPPEPELPC